MASYFHIERFLRSPQLVDECDNTNGVCVQYHCIHVDTSIRNEYRTSGLSLPCVDLLVASCFSIVVDKLGKRYHDKLIYVRKGLVCSTAFTRALLFVALYFAIDNLGTGVDVTT